MVRFVYCPTLTRFTPPNRASEMHFITSQLPRQIQGNWSDSCPQSFDTPTPPPPPPKKKIGEEVYVSLNGAGMTHELQ